MLSVWRVGKLAPDFCGVCSGTGGLRLSLSSALLSDEKLSDSGLTCRRLPSGEELPGSVDGMLGGGGVERASA
jgi:hypothetical protein